MVRSHYMPLQCCRSRGKASDISRFRHRFARITPSSRQLASCYTSGVTFFNLHGFRCNFGPRFDGITRARMESYKATLHATVRRTVPTLRLLRLVLKSCEQRKISSGGQLLRGHLETLEKDRTQYATAADKEIGSFSDIWQWMDQALPTCPTQ